MQRRSWTSLEDEVLIKRVKMFGIKQWSLVAQGLPTRNGKSCSERWRHFLDPAIKPPSQQAFTDYEAAVIVRAHALYGNKWQAIAALLPGRSCRAVKNYWHTNMGANAVTRGAIMVSNRFLAAGHSLEGLLSIAPGAASTCASEGAVVPDWSLNAQLAEQPSSCLMAGSPQLPVVFDAIQAQPQFGLQPTAQLDAHTQQQLLQLQQLLAGQQPDLSLCSMGLQQQQVPVSLPAPQTYSAPSAMAPATPAAAWSAPAAQEEEQCSASNSPAASRCDNTTFSNASLCDQLLMGFSAAPVLQPMHSTSSVDSFDQHSQQPSAMPLWATEPAAMPDMAMEQLIDQLDVTDFDAILADFDCDMPLDMALGDSWALAQQQQQQLKQQQQQQHVSLAQCPGCRAEAGLLENNSCSCAPAVPAGYAAAAAAAMASPTSSFGTSPGSVGETGAAAAAPEPLVSMSSVASMMSEASMDVSKVAALLAEQQERLKAQQLELQQQQLQLEALRAQLAQRPQ